MGLAIRPFLNTDQPHLVEIWRRQPRRARLAERVDSEVFEQRVLSKPYFDAQGLHLAFADSQPIGFVHASFGPNESGTDLDRRQGILSHLAVVHSHVSDRSLANDLVARGLDYLRERGAEQCHWGSRFPHAPFYLGMSGGSHVPGALEDDHMALAAAEQAGLTACGEVLILQRSLQDYRPVIERRQTLIRRQFEVVVEPDPPSSRWWDACQLLHDQTIRVALVDQRHGACAAQAVFWDMQPMAAGWGVAVMGLYSFHVAEPHRRSGLGTFLVSEAMRELARQGIGHVEVQLAEDDERGRRMAEKLGFRRVASARQLARRF